MKISSIFKNRVTDDNSDKCPKVLPEINSYNPVHGEQNFDYFSDGVFGSGVFLNNLQILKVPQGIIRIRRFTGFSRYPGRLS
jgi:hypothetical protein